MKSVSLFIAALLVYGTTSPTTAAAQPALINSVGSNSGGASAPISSLGANFAVVCGKANLITPTSMILDYDSANPTKPLNKWVSLPNSKAGYSTTSVGMYVAYNLVTSPNHVFVSPNGEAYYVMLFNHIASLDKTAIGEDAQSYPQSTGPITPSNPNELVAACDNGLFWANQPITTTVNAPFQIVGQSHTVTPDKFTSVETAIYTVTGSGSPTPLTLYRQFNQANGQIGNIATFYSDLSPAPLKVTQPDPLPEAVTNAPYTDASGSPVCISTEGGVRPFKYTITGAVAGITFDGSTGCFGGRSSSASSGNGFTVHVVDAQGHSADSTLLHLTVVPEALSFQSQTCSTATQLKPYSGCTLQAFGGDGNYTFSVSHDPNHTTLPEGMSLDKTSGKITSNRVNGQGIYLALVTITDASGGTTSGEVTIPVNGDNSAEAVVNMLPADHIVRLRVDNLPVDTAVYAQEYQAYGSTDARFRAVFGQHWYDGGVPINTVAQGAIQTAVDKNSIFYAEINNTVTPCDASMEGGYNSAGDQPGTVYTGDNHILTLMTGPNSMVNELYETYPNFPANTYASPNCTSFGSAGPGTYGGAVQWNPRSYVARPNGVSSADAGGLSLTYYLLKYDEVVSGPAGHAIRFTLPHTLNYHVVPATIQAGLGANSCTGGWSDPSGNGLIDPDNPPTSCGSSTKPGDSLNPMGQIYRLKASTVEPGGCASNPIMHNVFLTLKQNGMILSDNGLANGLVGTTDARWPDDTTINNCLSGIHGSDTEPVNIKSALVSWPSSYQTITSAGSPVTVTPAPPPVDTGGGTGSTTSGGGVTVTGNSTTVTLGQTVTLTAKVSGKNPTGTITFYSDGVEIGETALGAGGVGTLSTTSLSVGVHNLTASYSGDTGNTNTTSAVDTVTVNAPAKTAATITLSVAAQ